MTNAQYIYYTYRKAQNGKLISNHVTAQAWNAP
jgi:hypothetical protein